MVPILIQEGVPNHHGFHKALLDEMFKLRHVVFKERLNWDVQSIEGRERDKYDDLSPVYVLCRNSENVMAGCWRLLPTTGPYMLKDIFPELLDGHPAPRHPSIWEASRFAVHTQERSYRSMAGLNRITKTMLSALHEFGVQNNIEKMVAVSDVRFERLLIRSGASVNRFGAPRAVGDVKAVAGWLDINEETLARVRARAGLQGPTLH